MMSLTIAAPSHHQRDLQQQVYTLPPPQHQRSVSTHCTKGLLNRPGQNNCFLNSAVQVLWHLDIFRRSFRDLSGHACMADSCIFCALKELFAQFQYSQESALPPDALRRALAETFFDQQRFQLGFMDDAAECFENMLLRIHFHIANSESEDMCSAVHCIPHQKFAMTLVEQSVCHVCGATSEPLPFTQMVHYISASALCTQAQQTNFNCSFDFGKLLRKAGGMGDIRDCPSACGTKIQIRRSLMNRPEIVSIGIVWDSERPTLEHIMNVFGTIGTSLKLDDLFHSVVDNRWASITNHHLVGVVTYYGKHYSTFFFHTKLRIWIYFDDATVREIGPRWEQVVEKCQRGHFQPLLLLYANPQGDPIEVDTAPQSVTYVTGHRRLSTSSEGTNMKERMELKPKYTTAQRRAITPNPEHGREHMMQNLRPRRAVTPNPPDNHFHQQMTMNGVERKNHVGGNQIPPLPTYDQVDASRRMMLMREPPQPPEVEDQQDQRRETGMYISRQAVENVLNYQKLQRQRSLNYGSSNGGSRTSSSSLESFESPFVRNCRIVANKGMDGVGDKINDIQNVPRRRDSGNWSGDRNSASSSSSLSLEHPPINTHLHAPVQNKRHSAGVANVRHLTPGGVAKTTEMTPNPTYDPGYDSYSLSSNDSFPLSVQQQQQQQQQGKHNQQLAQIPENPQPWAPFSCGQSYQNEHKQNSSDNCEFLCAEADCFLIKCEQVENTGDFVGAISLCNSAAAKARAAMDAPYHNPQSIMLARMKHNTCVMKSRSLQRRLLARQESVNSHGSTTSTETDSGDVEPRHSRQSSSDSRRRLDGSHSRQGSRDSCGNHSRQGSRENRHVAREESEKKIEIYATLPKKGHKLMDKMDKLRTWSMRVKDEQFLNQMNYQNIQTHNQNPKEETSDYSSEWELTKKSSLHRTNSSPPALKELPIIPPREETGRVDGNKPTGGKKQHKIKRKLMAGLMRRKNRSMPDLREGQQNGTQIPQGGVTQRSAFLDDFRQERASGYLSDAHLDYGQRSVSEKCLTQQMHYGSQRQLNSKVPPPRPPTRTTSQLSLGYQTHLAKSMPLNASSPNLLSQSSDHVTYPIPSMEGSTKVRSDNSNIITSHHVATPTQSELIANDVNNSSLLAELQRKRKQILEKQTTFPDGGNNISGDGKSNNLLSNSKIKNEGCSWLQELQLKQIKMKQQRSDTHPSIMTSVGPRVSRANTMQVARNQVQPDKGVNCVNLPTSVSPVVRSVRDLASRFEQIGGLPPKVTTPPISPRESDYPKNPALTNSGVDVRVNEQDVRLKNGLNTDVVDGYLRNGTVLPQRVKNVYTNDLPVSKSSYVNAYSVQGHGNHGNPQPNVRSYQNGHLNGHEINGVINGVINGSHYLYTAPSSANYQHRNGDCVDRQVTPVNMKSPTITSSNLVKKKKSGKKSVTFSDQVALVASADEENEPHLPNPLLEKVLYQSVVSRQNKQPVRPPAYVPVSRLKNCSQNMFESGDVGKSSKQIHNPKVPCHLCRKKTVVPPIVYCPDCDFYMSRFRPKS